MSLSEEFPGVVKLNARQLGEVVLLIFGTKSIVGSGCCKDGSRTDCTNKELAILTDGDGGHDYRTESKHGVGKEVRRRERIAPGPRRLDEYILMSLSGTGD